MFALRLLLIPLISLSSFAHAQAETPDDSSLLNSTNLGRAIDEEDRSYLLRHNPFYFAYGNPLSKLQLSFRTKLLRDVPLYFAYTQLMFWALTQSSKPFRDLTYNPELFYRFAIPERLIKSIDIGYAHDSNGKAETDSRSYNTAYMRLNLEKEFHRWVMRLSVTGAYLHAFDDTNQDIQNYIGPLAFNASWIQLYDAWIDKGEFAIKAVPGGKFAQNWGMGGYQVSYSFRLGRMHLVPSFYLQYFFGHAESLLNYNESVKTFRAGFIF